MSKLDKLLEGVLVEWKCLGEICEVGDGNHSSKYPKSNEMVNHGVPFIRGTNIVKGTISDKDMKYITSEKHKELKKGHLKAYDVLITNRGEIGKTAYIPKHFAGSNLNSQLAWLRSNPEVILPKYLFFVLNTTHIQSGISGEGGALKQLTIKNIKLITIPVPSLKIQKEIVHVLDAFQELTTELTSELKARKKQYSYYREQLLTFKENEVEHLPMDDESLGEFIRGKRFVKTDMISEGVPCIHYGEMYTHYDTWADKTKSFVSKELVENKNLRLAEKGDVVLVAAGETIEDIGKGTAWLGEEGVVIHDACFYYKSDLNPKYVAYFTRTRQFHDQIKKHIRTGKISAINAKGLGKAIIPIPSTKEQERIVSILDKFDILTTSTSEGLPKEIALRKKQYEYYRNKLLTFPKDTVEA
jgi:type I restriction enzyme S subunit